MVRFHKPVIKLKTDKRLVRRSLTELEKTHAETVSQHKVLQERVKASETRLKELQARLDDDSSSDLIVINQRLVEELEDEKSRHQKDLEQGDFSSDQTRKKYQAELAQLSEGELLDYRDPPFMILITFQNFNLNATA